jgi:hypothetical protein
MLTALALLAAVIVIVDVSACLCCRENERPAEWN